MSLIGYMNPLNGIIVLELESILNQIFEHISLGSGFHYHAITMTKYGGSIYKTKDKHHISIDPLRLAELVMEIILNIESQTS